MTTTPRQALSLNRLMAEANGHAPGRYKASDGGIGDPRHQATKSDHNPNAAGVWRAVDITNDPDDHDGNPKNDMPGQDLANRIAAKLGKHPALGSGAYVIFNRRIISADRLGEGWRPYSGVNAHKTHVHVSVATARAGYDSTHTWNLWPTPAVRTPNIDLAITAVVKAIEVRSDQPTPTLGYLQQALASLRAARKAARA